MASCPDYVSGELWKLLIHPFANVSAQYVYYLKAIYSKLFSSIQFPGMQQIYQDMLDDEWLVDSEDTLECSRIKLVMNKEPIENSHIIMKIPNLESQSSNAN
jgi:hypothetical protein